MSKNRIFDIKISKIIDGLDDSKTLGITYQDIDKTRLRPLLERIISHLTENSGENFEEFKKVSKNAFEYLSISIEQVDEETNTLYIEFSYQNIKLKTDVETYGGSISHENLLEFFINTLFELNSLRNDEEKPEIDPETKSLKERISEMRKKSIVENTQKSPKEDNQEEKETPKKLSLKERLELRRKERSVENSLSKKTYGTSERDKNVDFLSKKFKTIDIPSESETKSVSNSEPKSRKLSSLRLKTSSKDLDSPKPNTGKISLRSLKSRTQRQQETNSCELVVYDRLLRGRSLDIPLGTCRLVFTYLGEQKDFFENQVDLETVNLDLFLDYRIVEYIKETQRRISSTDQSRKKFIEKIREKKEKRRLEEEKRKSDFM